MPSVVINFHAHLPRPLRRYSFFDIGHSQAYVDEEQNRRILEQTAKTCYLPVNAGLLKLIRRHRGAFRISCSISGMLLEQLEEGQKTVLESFRRLADTGCVEFTGAPYHHSLAFMFSAEEFREQVAVHRRKIRALFDYAPRVFRNTELMYGNNVASIVESMGFRVILAGKTGRLPAFDETAFYRPEGNNKMKILFRHDALSDEIAFCQAGGAGDGEARSTAAFARRAAERFSEKGIVNLFMDYEIFGERIGGETGIRNFLEAFPGTLLKRRDWRFQTPSDAAAEHQPADILDMPVPIFRADPGEDSAYLGNHMQKDAANTLYAMEGRVRETGKRKLVATWRNLQASDYFLHMRTNGHTGGATRQTFNPFPSPYDAYISYMNILKDFSGRIAGKTGFRT